ncbi:NfeD family protein [Phytohalomonas tamaricis]|uniref:NfeD family protein n=1 Tax=Phytohalomonas tamaricis TaxID=2081032 RepID=UPI000D0BA4D8|nr:nodulation protein NfeD [Phytohalomonas tamaricis]
MYQKRHALTLLPTLGWLLVIMLGTSMAAYAAAESAESGIADSSRRSALVMQLNGAVSPASADYFQRGLARAEAENAEVVVLELDTPGGLFASTRDMIAAILDSAVPVVIYVAPEGARAASAGTYLLYVSHIAAMAPATHLGAATPIQLIGGDNDDAPSGEKSDDNSPVPANAEQRKQLEDAVAYIRSLAERRGRNADWAERAVREAVTLTASEAEQQNVVDIVAPSLDALFSRIDGHEVALASGPRRLDTADIAIERFAPDWRTRLLSVIADPNIAYLLLLAGVIGLVFELLSPGLLLPGVLGAVSLLLSFYAFQILPVNVAGMTLLLVGIALIIAEAFAPGVGVLGFGGLAAFVVGSVLLMDGTGLWVSLPLIGGTALVIGGFLLWMVMRLAKLRRQPAQGGQEELIGAVAVARDDFNAEGNGHVLLHGERWNAHASVAVHKGQPLRVIAVNGLRVEVEPGEPQASPPSHISDSGERP